MGETDNLEINPGTEENGFGITQPAQQPERWTFTLQEVAALADQYDGMEDPLEREAASALFNEVWRNREAFMEYERQVELRTTEAMLGDPDTLAGEWNEELELASTLLHTDRNQARKRHANTRRLSALYNIPFHDMEPMQDIILALHMNRAGESVSDEEGFEFLKKEVAQSPMAGKQDNLPGHVEIINGKKVRVLNPIVFTEPLSKKELRRQERMEKHGDVEMPFWGKVFMGASTPIKVMFGWAVKHDAESMQEFAQSFMLPGSNIEVTPEEEIEGYKQMFTTVEGVSALGMGLAMGTATPGIARGAMPKKGRVPKTAAVAAEQNAKPSILPGHKINEPLVVGPHIGDGVVLIVPEKEAALQGAKPLNPGQYRIQPHESGYALLDHQGQPIGNFATTDEALSAGMDAVQSDVTLSTKQNKLSPSKNESGVTNEGSQQQPDIAGGSATVGREISPGSGGINSKAGSSIVRSAEGDKPSAGAGPEAGIRVHSGSIGGEDSGLRASSSNEGASSGQRLISREEFASEEAKHQGVEEAFNEIASNRPEGFDKPETGEGLVYALRALKKGNTLFKGEKVNAAIKKIYDQIEIVPRLKFKRWPELTHGAESNVYYDKDRNIVYKKVTLPFGKAGDAFTPGALKVNPEGEILIGKGAVPTIKDFLKRVRTGNQHPGVVFTKWRGITEDGKLLLEQPYAQKADTFPDGKDMAPALRKRGLVLISKSLNGGAIGKAGDKWILFTDLHGGNVLKKGDDIYIVDTISREITDADWQVLEQAGLKDKIQADVERAEAERIEYEKLKR